MDRLERMDPYEAAVLSAITGRLADVWTSLPGIVESFDPEAQTAVIQPAVQARVTNPNGSREWVTLPLLQDCPVFFPSGGGVTFTFPVSAGDECLVVFASRCIDAWWQSGGVQPQAELRMHDLSDGFAFVGVRAKPNVPGGISTTAAELRSADGAVKVSLNPASGAVTVTAPGGIVLSGDTQVNGTLDVTGDITTPADVMAGNISLKNHKTSLVTPGTGQGGPPVP